MPGSQVTAFGSVAVQTRAAAPSAGSTFIVADSTNATSQTINGGPDETGETSGGRGERRGRCERRVADLEILQPRRLYKRQGRLAEYAAVASFSRRGAVLRGTMLTFVMGEVRFVNRSVVSVAAVVSRDRRGARPESGCEPF